MLALCNSWDILALMYASTKRFDKIEHALNDSTLDYLGGYLYELVAGYQKVCQMINFRMPGLSRHDAQLVLGQLVGPGLAEHHADMCADMYYNDIKWIINTRGRGTAKVICEEVLKRMNLTLCPN
jgi:hypothetical protein